MLTKACTCGIITKLSDDSTAEKLKKQAIIGASGLECTTETPGSESKDNKLFEKDLKKCLTNKLGCGKINKSPNEGNFKKSDTGP